MRKKRLACTIAFVLCAIIACAPVARADEPLPGTMRPKIKEAAELVYPPASQLSREEGTVVVNVFVDEDGKPSDARVEKSSGFPLLDQSAMDAVKGSTFHPGTVNGTPAKMRHNFNIKFKCQDGAVDNCGSGDLAEITPAMRTRWEALKISKSLQDFEAFRRDFPESHLICDAKELLGLFGPAAGAVSDSGVSVQVAAADGKTAQRVGVSLCMRIGDDGRVREVQLDESSGDPKFDKDSSNSMRHMFFLRGVMGPLRTEKWLRMRVFRGAPKDCVGSSCPPDDSALKAQLAAAASGNVAPRAMRGNSAPYYPMTSRRNREEGNVVLNVLVDTRGRATEVGVEQSSGFPALDEAARVAISYWKFEPGREKGRPVKMSTKVTWTWRCKDDEGIDRCGE